MNVNKENDRKEIKSERWWRKEKKKHEEQEYKTNKLDKEL